MQNLKYRLMKKEHTGYALVERKQKGMLFLRCKEEKDIKNE